MWEDMKQIARRDPQKLAGDAAGALALVVLLVLGLHLPLLA